jgi:RNA polymerase sigma-70 factor (ECF subfamily)
MAVPSPISSSDTWRSGGELEALTLMLARAGNRDAQAALIERYQQQVFSLLWRVLGAERAVIEDLAQETFLRVLGALPRFEPNGRARLATWILTIATHVAIDHSRAAVERRHDPAPPGSVPTPLRSPEQDADRRVLANALMSAIDGLGPQYRAAFLLREVHGMPYEEISQTLAVDLGTVKSRIHRARMLLQRALVQFR